MTTGVLVKKGWFGFGRKEPEEHRDPYAFSFQELREDPRIRLDPVAVHATDFIEKLTEAASDLEKSFAPHKLKLSVDLANRAWREYFVTYGEHPAILQLGEQFAAVMGKIDDSVTSALAGMGEKSRRKAELEDRKSAIGFYRNALEVLMDRGVIAAEEAMLRDTRNR